MEHSFISLKAVSLEKDGHDRWATLIKSVLKAVKVNNGNV